MAIFQSALFNGAGRQKLEDCKAQDLKHIFKGSPPGPHIARIQEALRRLGFTVTDAAEVFGQSTSDAVFKFKGPPRNILQPGQREPDRFVGKRTITQLDEEVAALEGKKVVPVSEIGSNNWRFTFFGNKGFTGTGIYNLFIGSTETADSINFTTDVQFEGGSLLTGFKGEARGSFRTTAKIPARRFTAARCELNLFKLLGRDNMQGFARLQLIGDDNLSAFLPINELPDETIWNDGHQRHNYHDRLSTKISGAPARLTATQQKRKLALAARAGAIETAAGLLGANPELAQAWEPMMHACFEGHHAIVKLLLESGADPNMLSSSTWAHRPLHRVVGHKIATLKHDGHRKTVRVILNFGADPLRRATRPP